MIRFLHSILRAIAVVLFAVLVSGAVFLPLNCYCENAAAQEDQEWSFEVPAKGESKVYDRPAKAVYFWWDTDDSVQVELAFDDGTKLKTGSSKEFSKRIVSVKFINPGAAPFAVKLWARF